MSISNPSEDAEVDAPALLKALTVTNIFIPAGSGGVICCPTLVRSFTLVSITMSQRPFCVPAHHVYLITSDSKSWKASQFANMYVSSA